MSTERSTDAAVAGLFGGTAPKAKAKGKSKVREEVEAPKELRDAVDLIAASRQFIKQIEKKVKTAEGRVKTFGRQHWAEAYTKTGAKPGMFTVLGNEGSFDYSQTSRVHFNHGKQEALSMMGIDLAEHVETTGIEIDMAAIASLGYMDKLMESIKAMVGDNPEHVAQIFTPTVKMKKGILEALPKLVRDSLSEGETEADKLVLAVVTLGAVDAIKNPEIDKTSTECFELVMEAKLDAKT
jgi:hypothetical protein